MAEDNANRDMEAVQKQIIALGINMRYEHNIEEPWDAIIYEITGNERPPNFPAPQTLPETMRVIMAILGIRQPTKEENLDFQRETFLAYKKAEKRYGAVREAEKASLGRPFSQFLFGVIWLVISFFALIAVGRQEGLLWLVAYWVILFFIIGILMFMWSILRGVLWFAWMKWRRPKELEEIEASYRKAMSKLDD